MKRRQLGITLIDVMVAVILFAVGVLGLVALQARSSQTSVNAESRIYAALLADDLAGTFISNAGVLPSTYLTAWTARVASKLPGGTLPSAPAVTGSAAAGYVLTITINWYPTSAALGSGNPDVLSTTAYYP